LHFLTDTLTIPKIKDLVNTPNEKYRDIYNIIERSDEKPKRPVPSGATDISMIPSLSDEHLPMIKPSLPVETKQDMKNELKNFMKSHMKSEGKSQSAPQFMPI
jgi:hypothetical protein